MSKSVITCKIKKFAFSPFMYRPVS